PGSLLDTLQPEYDTENPKATRAEGNNARKPRPGRRWRGATRREQKRMVKKIALEEHFLSPGFEEYWRSTVGDVDPAILKQVSARLTDFGELRLAAMDRAGITRSVLSIAGPGVQAEKDAHTATRNARA